MLLLASSTVSNSMALLLVASMALRWVARAPVTLCPSPTSLRRIRRSILAHSRWLLPQRLPRSSSIRRSSSTVLRRSSSTVLHRSSRTVVRHSSSNSMGNLSMALDMANKAWRRQRAARPNISRRLNMRLRRNNTNTHNNRNTINRLLNTLNVLNNTPRSRMCITMHLGRRWWRLQQPLWFNPSCTTCSWDV